MLKEYPREEHHLLLNKIISMTICIISARIRPNKFVDNPRRMMQRNEYKKGRYCVLPCPSLCSLAEFREHLEKV